MLRKFLYSVIILCLTAGLLFSQKTSGNKIVNVFTLVEGKVNTVYDGDTIAITTKDGKTHLVRMLYIDAPAEKQSYGAESKKNLGDLILGKDVTVVIRLMDSNDRYLGTVFYDERDVNFLQIETGMAWHFKQLEYEQSAKDRKTYAQAEQKARNKRKGLWEDKNPTPPWDFKNSIVTEESVVKERDEKQNQLPAISNPSSSKPPEVNSKTQSDKKYIRGPRGGCYYINSKGSKTYVDRSLCN